MPGEVEEGKSYFCFHVETAQNNHFVMALMKTPA
jgi:hypothetical protein